VASVVGLTIIHVFGFESALPGTAEELAEKCGVAFQLTNILRDVREDALNSRIYLPEEDLVRFQVSSEELRGQHLSPNLRRLLEFETQRARRYYRESAPLVGMIRPRNRAALRALIGIYSRLLDRIADSNYDVLSRRIRVPTWEKLWTLGRSVV
jgi:phytoene synthase